MQRRAKPMPSYRARRQSAERLARLIKAAAARPPAVLYEPQAVVEGVATLRQQFQAQIERLRQQHRSSALLQAARWADFAAPIPAAGPEGSAL